MAKKRLGARVRWILVFGAIMALPIIFYGCQEFPHWWHYHRLEREGKWRSSVRVVGTQPISSSDVLCEVEVTNLGTGTWPEEVSLGSCERWGNSRWGRRQTPPQVRIVAYTTRIPWVKNGDRYPVGRAILPGGSLTLFVTLHPQSTGSAVLFLQMVNDNRPREMGWFGQETRLEIEGKQ
jgi:hypothetical protein